MGSSGGKRPNVKKFLTKLRMHVKFVSSAMHMSHKKIRFEESWQAHMMSCAVLGDAKKVEEKADEAFPPTHHEYESGDWLWIQDGQDAWLPAKVVDGDHRDRSPGNHVDVEVMGTLACLSNAGVRRLTGADNQARIKKENVITHRTLSLSREQ